MNPACLPCRHIIMWLVAFFLYLLLGAVIMYYVEVKAAEKRSDTAPGNPQENQDKMDNLWREMSVKYNMTLGDFDRFTAIVKSGNASESSALIPWTLKNAYMFMFTLCTTIGYGILTPRTGAGQMLCVPLALFGIPLTLMTLNAIGALIVHACTNLINRLETRLLKRRNPQREHLKCLAVTFLLMVVIVITASAFTTYTLPWTMAESIYFWFISLSTVGFGDYTIPLNEIKPMGVESFVSWAVFLIMLVGLSVVASVINASIEAANKITSFGVCCSAGGNSVEPAAEVDETTKQPDTKNPRCKCVMVANDLTSSVSEN